MMLKSLKSAYLGFWTTLVAIIMVAILCFLGTWQVKRLQWKENLISTMERQLQNDPVPLPQKIEGDWAYRPVMVTGTYLPQHVFYIEPRTQNGVVGYHRFVAFQQNSNDIVFVNTGWTDQKDISDITTAPTKLVGYIRYPEAGAFTPINNIQSNIWYWPSPWEMGQVAGFENVTPVLVYLDKPDLKSIPNNHLQYAVFWFGMAFIAVIFYILMGRSKKEGQNG